MLKVESLLLDFKTHRITDMRKAKAKKKARTAWTEDEVKLLKKLYRDENAQTIADKLGWTVTAVMVKAYKLGICEQRNVWSKREVNLLKRLYPNKTAEQIGRSERAMRIRKDRRRYLLYEDRHRVVKGVRQKLCRKCNQWINETGFHRSSREKDGLKGRCKKCAYAPTGKSRRK